MSYRQQVAKPSVALWILVALGDVALIVAHLGIVAVLSVVTVAVAVLGGWHVLRRSTPSTRRAVPVRAGSRSMVPTRRRA